MAASLARHVGGTERAASMASTASDASTRIRSWAHGEGARRAAALSVLGRTAPDDAHDDGSSAPVRSSRAVGAAARARRLADRARGGATTGNAGAQDVAAARPGGPRQRTLANRANAPSPIAPTDMRQPRQRTLTKLTNEPAPGGTPGAPPSPAAAAGDGGHGRPSARGIAATQARANQEAARASLLGAQGAPQPHAVSRGTGKTTAAIAAAKGTEGSTPALVAAMAATPAAAALSLLLLVALVVAPVAGIARPTVDPAWLAGLPPYITSEMLLAAVECQEEFGHPAGCTIAQVIVESGCGDELSSLAEDDHNLFGIKWVPDEDGAEGVTGHSEWATGEEAADGSAYTTRASFTTFESDAACIRFRSSWFLQLSNYRDNAIIRQAVERRDSDLMADGLADAGWATSHTYAEALRSVIATYDLKRLDRATPESLSAASAVTGAPSDGSLSARQAAVVSACSWVPSPGAGFCAAWVSDVFEAAGMGYPGGNARDYYWWWCTSSDLSELRPGMVVAVSTYPTSGLGATYGHVGIYVGGGMVAENVGTIQRTPIETWIGWYSGSVTPRWGWVYGTDLSR